MDKQNIVFSMDAILDDNIRDSQRESAKGLFMVFQDFVNVGFTEDQAMELLIAFMSMNAKRAETR